MRALQNRIILSAAIALIGASASSAWAQTATAGPTNVVLVQDGTLVCVAAQPGPSGASAGALRCSLASVAPVGDAVTGSAATPGATGSAAPQAPVTAPTTVGAPRPGAAVSAARATPPAKPDDGPSGASRAVVGGIIGAGAGALGGAVLDGLVLIGSFNCDGEYEECSDPNTGAITLVGGLMGAVVGVAIGLATDGGAEAPPAAASRGAARTAAKLSPVFGLSKDGSGAMAGLSGTF